VNADVIVLSHRLTRTLSWGVSPIVLSEGVRHWWFELTKRGYLPRELAALFGTRACGSHGSIISPTRADTRDHYVFPGNGQHPYF
jgi:hypothetical protein